MPKHEFSMEVPHSAARLVVAMTDVLAEWARSCRPDATAAAEGPLDAVPGYGVYPTTDGHVALGVLAEDNLWAATCTALGLDGAVAGLGFAERLTRTDELQQRITERLARMRRDDAVAVLAAAGAPATPVRTLGEL